MERCYPKSCQHHLPTFQASEYHCLGDRTSGDGPTRQHRNKRGKRGDSFACSSVVCCLFSATQQVEYVLSMLVLVLFRTVGAMASVQGLLNALYDFVCVAYRSFLGSLNLLQGPERPPSGNSMAG